MGTQFQLLSPRQTRTYRTLTQQVAAQIDLESITRVAGWLSYDAAPLGFVPPPNYRTECGALFDYRFGALAVDLVGAIHVYEHLEPLAAIAVAATMCARCERKARAHYQLRFNQVSVGTCPYCDTHETTALMDAKWFEKFIAYDSFFGNYMVKRYGDILKHQGELRRNPNKSLPTLRDENWSEYFDQMLLQTMDHANDVRVQRYFNDLRDLPKTTVKTDDNVPSPYIKEDKPTILEDMRRGKKARNDVDEKPVPVYSAIKGDIWEPRLIRRRYTVDNLPVYPSSNIHWVKRINEEEIQKYQVLNFAPPQGFARDILSFELTTSQGYQLLGNRAKGKYPTSQASLDTLWTQAAPRMEIAL